MISLSFILVYVGEHAVTFLLGWEIAALSAWLLVIWDYPNQKVRFAGFNYLVSTHVGLIFLVAAIMILYGLVLVVHILISLILIGVILLQGGRGGMSEALSGTTAQSLFGGSAATVLTKATAARNGDYTVVVKGIGGSTPSTVAKLTVATPPAITTQPGNLTVPAALSTPGRSSYTASLTAADSFGVSRVVVNMTQGGVAQRLCVSEKGP